MRFEQPTKRTLVFQAKQLLRVSHFNPTGIALTSFFLYYISHCTLPILLQIRRKRCISSFGIFQIVTCNNPNFLPHLGLMIHRIFQTFQFKRLLFSQNNPIAKQQLSLTTRSGNRTFFNRKIDIFRREHSLVLQLSQYSKD
jgi:hypothetical protein